MGKIILKIGGEFKFIRLPGTHFIDHTEDTQLEQWP
jgi:hypothetical protein